MNLINSIKNDVSNKLLASLPEKYRPYSKLIETALDRGVNCVQMADGSIKACYELVDSDYLNIIAFYNVSIKHLRVY